MSKVWKRKHTCEGVMMSKIEVGTSNFKMFVDAIGCFCREGDVRFEQSRLRFVGVDAAGVALTECEIPAKLVDGEEERVGLDFNKLQQVAKKSQGDNIILDHYEGLVKIKVDRTTYKLQTIFLPSKDQPIPTIPSTVHIKMLPSDLASGILAVTDMADTKDANAGVWFLWNDGKFVLRDKAELNVEVEYAQDEYDGNIVEGIARVLISKMYAEPIAGILKKYDVCRVSVGTEMPLVVIMKKDECKCGFVIAPRVEVG